MTTTAAKVVAGTPKLNGAVFRAVLGTAVPTNETTALNAAFKSQGYVSSEGMTRAIAKAYETIRSWEGDEVKDIKTEVGVTLEFALIEANNGEALKTVFGDANVTVTPGVGGTTSKISISVDGSDPVNSAWIFELKDGVALRRVVCPIAQLTTEDFEQEFANGSVIQLPVRLKLRKDSAGKFFYEYVDDGIPVP